MGAVFRDLRYGIRSLVRSPGFSLVVVGTLALGIGANTAIFSVVDAVLLQRLPYYDSERLVTLWQDVSRRGGPVREWLNYPMLEDVRAEPGLFEAVAAWGSWGPTLTAVQEPEVLQAAEVSQGMFASVLRVRPMLGRTFLPSDDFEGAPGVALLSHAAWQARYGGDPEIVGRSISLSEIPYTVVGVLPEGFRPPFLPDAELWRALGTSGALRCGRGCFGIRAIGRLAPGVSLAQARAHTSALAARLEEAFPDTNTNLGMALFGLREDMTRNASRALWVLLGAVGFVLLIACINVANLLLVRGASRDRELAVRVALGAGTGPLVRQVLMESLILAALGGVAGLALAAWGTEALLGLAPAGSIPRLEGVGLDGRVLAFTVALTGATGLLFGLLPAWRASRQDVRSALGAPRGRGLRNPGFGLGGGLVVAQVGLALVLLVGAGLLLRSFQRLDRAALGFDPEGVLALNVALPVARYPDGPARQAYYQALLSRLASLPGVRSVGAANSLPLAGNDGDSDFLVEGEPVPEAGVSQAAWVRPVTDGYFETLGLELVEGRMFAPGDDAAARPVIVVNQTLAARHFPDGDAVGRRIGFGPPENPNWRTIVGVAGDVRHFGLKEETRPAAYFPYRQVSMAAMSVVVAVDGDPRSLIHEVRSSVSGLDPALAASGIQPLQDMVDAALAPDRFVTGTLALFALAALLLAAVGIYGVVSYGVTRRMREMGIRLALGADDLAVLSLVARGAVLLAAAGAALGFLGSLALGRVLGSLLYEIEATDPLTLAATSGVLATAVLLAAWIPARRAVRADPVSVLRQD